MNNKSIAVDSNNYVLDVDAERYSPIEDDEEARSRHLSAQIPDPIRYFSANFWTAERGQLVAASANTLFSVHKTNMDNVYELRADRAKFLDKTFTNGILQKDFSPDRWGKFADSLIEWSSLYKFFDHATEMHTPVVVRETSSGIKYENFINREFIYNFYAPEYENLLRGRTFNVIDAPSFYNFYKPDSQKTDTDIRLASLGGGVDLGYLQSLYLNRSMSEQISEYYKKYTDVYGTSDGRFALDIPEKDTIAIPDGMIDQAADAMATFVPAPMYMSAVIGAKVSQKDAISKRLLHSSRLNENLIDFTGTTTAKSVQNMIFGSDMSGEKRLNYYNIQDWVDANISVTDEGDAAINNLDIKNVHKIVKYLNGKDTRKYGDLMTNSGKYENIFYKIEKKKNGYDGKVLSTFYITPGDREIVYMIDTQLKYDEEYSYVVTAYMLIPGVVYQYSPYYGGKGAFLRLEDISNARYYVKVTEKPTYKIFEIPYGRFSGGVVEAPHVKPNISFTQRQNTIALSLDETETSSEGPYYPIENGELEAYKKIAGYQENDNLEHIEYGPVNTSDVTLQIYRTTTYPTDVLGFQGKLYKEFQIKDGKSYIEDTLALGKKYYYMFRFLNIHGIPSAPSKVQEVYVENQEGQYILHTSEVKIDQKAEFIDTKDFKRYLLLRPSQIQLQPNNLDDLGNLTFGPQVENLYGRNVIVKIRSKNSNRTLAFRLKSNINKKN